MDYTDFILRISPGASPNTFVVCASSAGEGEAHGTFSPPFDETQLENFVLKVGLTRRGVRKIHSPEWQAAQAFGQKLFSALFTEEPRALLHASLNTAYREDKGLRIKIILDAPALSNYPWEFLYDSRLDRFATLFQNTLLVRYIELPSPVTPLQVAPPLHVLVLTCSPKDYQRLDVQRERDALTRPLAELERRGLLTVRWLEHTTLDSLRGALLSDTFHVFHFVGHGGFDESSKDGVLVFEDASGQGRPISAERLAILLGNHPTLRLVLLNACEGARTSVQDPFAGAAMTLVRTGQIPAVVAMQFEITDEASIAFSLGFYEAIAKGKPVDAAVTEGRLAILAQDNDVEWGTPVLYLRAPDGVIFDPTALEKPAHMEPPGVIEEQHAPQPTKTSTLLDQERRELGRIQVQPHAAEPVEPTDLVLERSVPEQLGDQTPSLKTSEPELETSVQAKGQLPVPGTECEKIAETNGAAQQRADRVVSPHSRSFNRRLPIGVGVATLLLLCTISGCWILSIIPPFPTTVPTRANPPTAIAKPTTSSTLPEMPRATTAPANAIQPPPTLSVPSVPPTYTKLPPGPTSAPPTAAKPTPTWTLLSPAAPKPPLPFTVTPVGGGKGLLAFASTRGGSDDVYMIRVDGSEIKRLTNNPANDNEPAWSPDGSRIVFVSDRNGNPQILLMNADGSDQHPLSQPPSPRPGAPRDLSPAWSPDGTRIAFQSDRDTPLGSFEIYVMNADGSQQMRVTNDPAYDGCPSWSADSRRLAFLRNRDGTANIWVMDANGANASQLTNTGADSCPAWSPDGTRMAFDSRRDGNSEIYIMNADGSRAVNLTRNAASDFGPTWSPDGTRIAFCSDRDGNREIYVMNADGSNQFRLTHDAAKDQDQAWGR